MGRMLSVTNHMHRLILVVLVFVGSAAWAVDAQLPAGSIPQPTIIGPANTVTGNASGTAVPSGGDLTAKAGRLLLSNFSVAAGGSFRVEQVPYFPAAPIANPYQLLPGATTVLSVSRVQWYAGESNINYEWSKAPGSSDGTVTFTSSGNNNAINPTASFSLPGTYYLQVTANAGNGVVNSYQVATPVVVGKLSQTITFAPIDAKTYGVAPFAVTATASSGLQVTIAVQSGPATMNGNQLSVTGAGMVTLAATQAGNGTYEAAQPVLQSFSVAPATLQVVATDVARTYGTANPTQFNYTIAGLVNNDQPSIVTGTPTLGTSATQASTVGPYTITVATTGMAAPNYTVTGVPGTLTITPATLQITADDKNAVYGDTNLPAFTWSASGFKNGENESVITGAPGLATSATPLSDVGTYEITTTVAGTGLSAQNYTFTGVNGSLHVTKAPLTVIADDKSRPYNSENPTFTWTATGYRNGQDASVISGAPDLATSAVPSSSVGTYPITVEVGSMNATNYSFARQDGTLTIVKAAQTITFNSLPQKQVGDPPFNLTASASSGLEVHYASSSTSVATVNEGTVVIVGPGRTTITANQGGNDAFEAAAEVSQELTVVDPSNLPPTIAEISDRSTEVGDGPFSVDVIVADAETSATLLVTTAESSNQTLVPNANMTISGSYAIRSLLVTPASNQTGYTTISVTVSDGVNSTTESFQLTVNGSSQPPLILGSKVSPYCHILEQDLTDAQVTVTGNGGISRAVQMVGTSLAFADVTLEAGHPTTITTKISRPGSTPETTTLHVGWETTDLGTIGTGPRFAIRKGDSLLFENSVATNAWILETGLGDGPTSVATQSTVAVRYLRAGHFTAVAREENGTIRGSIEVLVLDAPISPDEPIIAQVGYMRKLRVTVSPFDRLNYLTFVGLGEGDLAVTREQEAYEYIDLGIKPLRRGSPAVVARINGDSGPIISWKPVEEFEIEQRSTGGLLMHAAVDQWEEELYTDAENYLLDNTTGGAFYMKPYLPNVSFTVATSCQDGQAEFTVLAASIERRQSAEGEEFGAAYFAANARSGGNLTWTIEAIYHSPTNAAETQVGETEPVTAAISRITEFGISSPGGEWNDENDPVRRAFHRLADTGIELIPVPNPYDGFESQGFRAVGNASVLVKMAPENALLRSGMVLRLNYYPAFNGGTEAGPNIGPHFRKTIPATQETTPVQLDFFDKIIPGPRAYSIMPAWDIDGDGKPELGLVSHFHKFCIAGGQMNPGGNQPPTNVTLTGIKLVSGSATGVSQALINENSQVEYHDDSVFALTVSPHTGTATGQLSYLHGSPANPDYPSESVSGYYAANGEFAEVKLRIGTYSFFSLAAVSWGYTRLDVQVNGAAAEAPIVFPTGSGTAGLLGSTGIDGILNPDLFPNFNLDIDADNGTSRITQLVIGDEYVNLPVAAMSSGSTWLKIWRDHPFEVTTVLGPLFANPSIFEADLPPEAHTNSALEGYPAITLGLHKNEDATVIFKVGSVPQRTIRVLRFAPGLGMPSSDTPTSEVIPGHLWINHRSHNLFFTAACAKFATPNLAPSVQVFYNSLDNMDCGLGRGWRTNYDMRVYKVNRNAVLINEMGEMISFWNGRQSDSIPGVQLAADLDPKQDLVAEGASVADFQSGEEFRVRRNNNLTYYFRSDGWLVRIRNIRGEELSISRQANGYAQSVTDSHGRTEALTRQALGGGNGTGPLTTLNGGISGSWEFDGYGTDGNLRDIRVNGNFVYQAMNDTPEQVTYRIEYDDANHPTSFKDASRGDLQTSISYPDEVQYYVGVTGPYGALTKIYYGTTTIDSAGIAHVTTELAWTVNSAKKTNSFIAQSSENHPYYIANTARMSHVKSYDEIGNLVAEEVTLDAEKKQKISYLYEKLRLNNVVQKGSNVLSQKIVHSVEGVGSGIADLITLWSYHQDTEARLGLIESITQADGSVTQYGYDESGRLTSQTDARGFTWTFGNHVPDGQAELGVGLPRTIQAPGPEATHAIYQRLYYRDGSLASQSDQRWNYTTTYRNDSQGRQVGITYPNAPRELVTTYDPFGRVIHQKDLEGLDVVITYDALGRITGTQEPGRVNDVTNYVAAGTHGYRATTTRGTLILADQQFDAAGRLYKDYAHRELVEFGDPVEECPTTYHYNTVYGWLDQIEDPMGRMTTFERDLAGRVTRTRSPLQASMRTTLNGLGWPLTVIDPDDHESRIVYSELGRPRFEINPAGGWVETRYDPNGNVVAEIPSQGAGTTYEYTEDGSLRLTIDPFGNRTERIINAQNRQIQTKVNDIIVTTQTATFNTRGLPESISNSVLGTTQMSYYDDGSIDTVTPQGRGQQKRLRDADKRTQGASFPVTLKGGVNETLTTSVIRDENTGVAIGSRSPNKHKQVTVRSAVTGEANETQDNAHSANLETTTTVTKVLVRDANGNVKRFEDALGHPTEQTFDEDGRLKTRYQNGVMTEWFYLPSGRVEYVTRAGVERVRYEYNSLGQVTKLTTPGRSPRVTSYDSLGLKLYESDGSLATSYFYDPLTRVLTEAVSSDGKIVTHRRDDRGRQTSETDNRGNGVHSRYDDLDRVTRRTHMDGKYESFTYYPTGEVETKTDRAGKVIRYEYDPSGNLLHTIYVTANKTKTYERTLPATGGVVEEVTYDGHVETKSSDVRSRTVQVTRTDPEDDTVTDVTMTYNAANQLTGKGVDAFGHNQFGQLTSIQRPGLPDITFTYNAVGQVEHEVLPNQVARTYTYDTAGAVSSITQQVGMYSETWNVGRDGQGRITSVTHPDHVQLFTYDDRGRLILEEHQEQDFSSITQHSYDVSDNRTRTVAFSGVESTTLTFDDGQLPTQVSPDQTMVWQVQTQGSRTTLVAADGPGTLTAQLDLHQAPTFLVPVLALQLTVGQPLTATGSTAAGVTLRGVNGDAYRAVWERRSNPAGSFDPTNGRVVLQRIDGGTGTATSLATSTSLGGDGGVVGLTVILTPDGLLRATAVVPNQGVLCAEAATQGIDSRAFAGTMGLVASAVGEAVSATFDDLTWATATRRKATSADYNAFNQLLSENEIDSQTGESLREYEYDILGNQTKVVTTVGEDESEVAYGYDALDRMSSVVVNGQATSFTYFGDSWMRLSAQTGNLIKNWTYDDRHVTSQSVRFGQAGIPTVTAYLTKNGMPLLEQTTGITSVYARDPLGNVVGYLGGYPNGEETFYHYTRKFTYDAYGSVKREQFGQFAGMNQGVEFPVASDISPGPRYKGLWFDAGSLGMYKTQTRSYSAGTARFTQVDPAKAGMNWYAYCGGDPVNRMDPSGLDYVYIDGGTVFWQRENPGTLWDSNVGAPIAIGKTTDDQWVNIDSRFGGGLVDYGTLKYHARKTYSGSTGDSISDLGMAAIMGEARGDNRTHEYMPWINGAEGALRVGYEPLGLLKTGVEGLAAAATVPFGGRRLASEDMRTEGFFPDSMLFAQAARRLDDGASRVEVGWEVGRDVFVRGNPATGIPLAAFDVYQGSREGDHGRVGGGLAGLGMYGLPAAPKLAGAARGYVSLLSNTVNLMEAGAAVARRGQITPAQARGLAARGLLRVDETVQGRGATNSRTGAMRIQPGLRGRTLAETIAHEAVHSVLARVFTREMQTRTNNWYQRGGVWTFLEEASAEYIGTGNYRRAVRFPVDADPPYIDNAAWGAFLRGQIPQEAVLTP